MSRPLLEIERLTLRREGRSILHDVSLTVRDGDIHALLGLNGSGKSSLAYAVKGCAGYLPDQGEIRFDGHVVGGLSITERARAGITLAWQEPARIEGLTLDRYISAGLALRRSDQVAKALEFVGLDPDRYRHRLLDARLSGGERKRVELAAVYAMRPQLAILDEPDSGIDTLSLSEIVGLIRRMAAEGTTVVLITHREDLTQACHMSSLMCAGTVVWSGEAEAVRGFYRQGCRPCETLGVAPAAPAVSPGTAAAPPAGSSSGAADVADENQRRLAVGETP